MADNCTHLDQVNDVQPSSEGCEDCIPLGDSWVHLRMCMTCGHVGCCNNSKNRHAQRHYDTVGHPLIQTYEPGDEWWWCYPDELFFVVDGAPKFAHP